MKISATKPREQLSQSSYSLQQKIRFYDSDNAYPQNMLKAIGGSSTASSCVDIYRKFIRGAGLADSRLLTEKANKKETFSQLHKKLCDDFAIFSGFAVHVGYNAMLQPVSYSHIPFEHCRYVVDADKNPTGQIAIHTDWTKESGRRFNNSDIVYLNPFNPDIDAISAEIDEAEGFENWKGQVFYFTLEPIGSYPIAHADSVATWMGTQAAVSNVLFRNARFNFLPAGIMTVKKKVEYNSEGKLVEDTSAVDNAKAFQGDENALKMLIVEIEQDEEKPEYTPFQIQSLEKEYQFTHNASKEQIMEFYRIPLELIGRKTGAMFSTDAMIQAYNVYNSDTESERMTVQEAYAQLFVAKEGYDFTIKPKIYIESQPYQVSTTTK